MKSHFVIAVAASYLLAAQTLAADVLPVASQTKEVSNFALLDYTGRLHELRRAGGDAVVLFFTANGCPVARKSAGKLKDLNEKFADRGIQFWLVNSNSADDRKSIAQESIQLKLGHLPVLKDDTQGVARHLGVHRTCECVAISTKDWTVFYRGAIDDQLVEGTQKPQVKERYLETALNEFLSHKPISNPKTVAHGCIINYDGGEGPDSAPVSYAKEVAPILASKCVSCHSEGNIGSWSMTDHAHIKQMARTIEETILSRRMPPWDADPLFGKFKDNPSLTSAEAQTLLRWVHQGALRGEGDDLLASIKPQPVEDWPLGKPDVILRLPQPEQIPATGVLEYRHIPVAANNSSPGWVGGIWVRPGNKRVVHHVIARLKEKGDDNKSPEEREIYAGWAPGATMGWMPKGTGKYLPANAQFVIEMHYTPDGAATTDQTEVGLYFLPEPPQHRLTIAAAFDKDVNIKPGDANSDTYATYCFKEDATVYSFAPHMHLRGKWMKFELLRPDGRRETLLSVPRYDFNWQRTYKLAQPRKIPAGTWLLVSGGYDNSKLNPANPDPAKTVRWGDQSFEEMFIGFFWLTWDKEQLPAAGGE
jgi:peroxiredoxin